MANLDTLRNTLVNEFYDNSTMLNVAMNIEYFLCEEAILYPYKNWFKGEIIAGPYIKRFNVKIILRYDYTDMPDPEGALVLKRFGVDTKYKKIEENVVDDSDKSEKKKYVKKPAWYIILNFPRNLISDEAQRKQLDLVDELVDLEALETAANENMEEESVNDFGGDFDFGNDNSNNPEPDFGTPDMATSTEEPPEET